MYNKINWREQEDPDFYLGNNSEDNYTYNDEGFDDNMDESYEKIRPIQTPRFLGGVKGQPFSPAASRPFQGSGTISTPAGTANVSLPQNLATKAELKSLEQKVLANNKAILANGQAINRINANLKQLDVELQRRINANTKNISNVQQAQMFSALLPPKLEEITATTSAGGKYTVTDSKFNMTSALLPALLTGSFGGNSDAGSSSGQSDMMLPLVLMATGGLGGSSSSGDNSSLILALALMMGNKK